MLRRNLFILLLLLLVISVIGYALFKPEPTAPASADGGEEAGLSAPLRFQPVIDPGHGGFDPGTETASGDRESQINLEIALKTELLMRFFGLCPVMTRESDVSLNDPETKKGDAKVSDLNNRVKMVNSVENGALISIHQNYFEEQQYYGAQVFYSSPASGPFAQTMQETLRAALDPVNTREHKKLGTAKLLNDALCPAILIECGFLSNPGEASRLQSDGYQRKVALAIVKGFLDYTRSSQ